MQAVRGRGTSLGRRFFSSLAAAGIQGWKKNPNDVIGKPDVAFPGKRVAIFLDGCFWHGCKYCGKKLPKTNTQYWAKKIKRNCILAKMHNRKLRALGWRIFRIWEHEIAKEKSLKLLRVRITKTLC
jgi:DNA mismatch endonuclease (patch repair protein)